MKKNEIHAYAAPEVSVCGVVAEFGFAGSGKNWYDSESDGSDVVWGYDATEDMWG